MFPLKAFIVENPLVIHSQKQLAQWAAEVMAQFYECWLSDGLRCNFWAADVVGMIISNVFQIIVIFGLS